MYVWLKLRHFYGATVLHMKDAKFSRWWSIANIEFSLTIFYWTFNFLFLWWKKHNNHSLTFSKRSHRFCFCDDGFLKNNNNDNFLRKVNQSSLLFTFDEQQYIINHRYDFICIFWSKMFIFVDMRCTFLFCWICKCLKSSAHCCL